MKLSTLMTGKEPSPSFSGVATADDFVLAVDIASSPTGKIGDYVVVQGGITNVDSQLNPESEDKTYIRNGKVTTKTATQRTFNVTGDRMFGDDFQDYALSHAIKFGTGQAVIVPYVYFSLLTGKGEKGTAAVIVNSDGSGKAGASAEIDVDIMATAAPTEYTYSADV